VRWTILSEAAPEQCADRLREQIAPWFPWWSLGDRRFRGHASDRGFRLYARPYARRSHRLEAVGRFEVAGGGTRVRVRFRHERRVVLFSMGAILLLVGLVASDWASVAESFRRLPRWQTPVILAIVPLAVWIGLRAQRGVDHTDGRALRRALLETLSAREETPEESST
jgi:hypothetical protein